MTDLRYLEQLESALQAVRVDSQGAFSWLGQPSARLAAAVFRRLDADSARQCVHSQLRVRLYQDFYCSGGPRAVSPSVPSHRDPRQDAFVRALSDANAGCGQWVDGRVVEADRRNLLVEQSNGLVVRVAKRDCDASPQGEPSPGRSIRFRLAKELVRISPGFYLAQSNRPFVHGGRQRRIRIYFNVSPGGASTLMSALTERLNALDLPFHLKMVSNPDDYARCDSAVLYLLQNDYRLAMPAVAASVELARQWIRPGVPSFSKRLADGVGLAEDPEDGESFGWHRCGILAQGILQASRLGARSVPARRAVVERQFGEHGIDLRTPYLNSASRDLYDLSIEGGSRRTTAPPSRALGSRRSLDTACEIAGAIADQAIWHESRCTWLAQPLDSHSPESSGRERACIALGPDLYSGTSGIGLFLAEAAAAVHGTRLEPVARAAMLQAFATVESCPPAHRFGLHGGWLGIALAGMRAALLLDEPSLAERAVQLADLAFAISAPSQEFDVVSGLAGGILGTLCLYRMSGREAFVARAEQLAGELLANARRHPYGWSWRGKDDTCRQDLLGYSHGAAGAAHALLELFSITGNGVHEQAAQHALRYERHWFDAKACDWPDFRIEPLGGRSRRGQGTRAESSWCHGAGGIAVSRLRAFEILGDPQCKDEAELALNRTREVLGARVASDDGSFCLCHGLAGDAEILAYGDRVLGRTDAGPLVNRVAQIGRRYRAGHVSAQDRDPMERAPGLMVGQAGIGHFYLRLARPETASILVLDSRRWARA